MGAPSDAGAPSAPPRPLARVAYLGFDACDAGIVAELVAQGELPAFARVLAEGASVSTVAPTGVFPSAIWPTFTTGLTPDRHRYYSWSEVEAGGYRTRDTDPSEIRGTPFFETLSRSGHRVAVLDVPHTRPVEGLHGVMLSEWGCHDRHGATSSWPPELLAELNERVGPHPVGTSDGPGFAQFDPSDYLHRAGARRTVDELEAVFAALCEGHEAKRALSLSLLDEGGWDLFAVVFSESHCTGHQLWHVHDPDHPWHEPDARRRIGSPIVEMYRRLDATLAAHLDRLGPDTPVFVHLSHGMGPHYDGTDVLEHVLRLLDEPATASHRRVGDVLDRVDPSLRSAPVRAVGRVPAAAGAWRRWLQRQPRRTFADLPPESVDPADRAGRRWFAIPNNTVTGAVRFNVVGREPAGVVAPGAELDRLADELAGALAELVNIDTGAPLVLGVTRGDAVHEFGEDDPFPDVLIEWNRTAPIERVWSPRFGAIEVPRTHWRTGDHTPHGLFVALGPGIEPGPRGGPVGVEHLAPTVSAALGATLDGVDGRPIAGLVPGVGGRPPDPTWVVPPPPVATATSDRSGGSTVGRLREIARDAARRRAEAWLGLTELDRRVRDVEGSLAVVADEQLDTRRSATWATDLAGDARSRADAAQTYAEYVNNTVEVVAEALGELSSRVAGASERHDALERLDGRTRQLMRLAQIETTMRWIELVDQPEDLLISVVMPTYNRAALLPRSIGSLLAQEYGNWELVVVDDGSTDDTQAVLDAFDDPRIRRLRSAHVGCSGARNVALAEVSGDVVAYLDDDNVMHPRWLTSVAWAFSQRPDVDVVCGARVVDDFDRVHDWRTSGGMPWIQFEPFDRDRLELGNIADIGVMAHRSGLPGLHFDEDLVVYGDWDLLLRLTEEKPPLELPAIAIAYATDAPERLSTTDQTADHDLVQTKLRAGGATADEP